MADAAVVKVTPGLDGITLQNGQAQSGLLPSDPSFMVGTPTLLDPTRAPDGQSILWLQLQETPFAPLGDGAGELEVTSAGWTPGLTEAYADRVMRILGRHIENLESATLGRAVITPADLAARKSTA